VPRYPMLFFASDKILYSFRIFLVRAKCSFFIVRDHGYRTVKNGGKMISLFYTPKL
jgi:hypothetical protein